MLECHFLSLNGVFGLWLHFVLLQTSKHKPETLRERNREMEKEVEKFGMRRREWSVL
jgi:phosphoglycerate-specific signal transduction histidine kinase